MATDYEGNLRQAILDAQQGSREAMMHCLNIIEHPLKRLVRTYGKFTDRTGNPVDQQELYNEAILKILESFGNFQPNPHKTDEGIRAQYIGYFLTVVKPKIRMACQQAIRPINIPDWAVKYAPRIQRAIEETSDALGPAFSYNKLDPEDIAMRSGAPLSRVKLYLKKQLGRRSAALFAGWDEVVSSCVEGAAVGTDAEEAHGGYQGTQMNHERSVIEEGLLSDESKKLITRSWKFLKEQQKQVLALRYGLNTDPMGRREIAEKLGMTNFQVRKAEADGLEIIRESLEGMARPAARAGA